WKVRQNVTLNLGLRYDIDSNAHSEKVRFLPWLPGNLPHDKSNLAPRLGINFGLNDRTVLRGGYGLFYAFSPNDGVQQTEGYLHRRPARRKRAAGEPDVRPGDRSQLSLRRHQPEGFPSVGRGKL